MNQKLQAAINADMDKIAEASIKKRGYVECGHVVKGLHKKGHIIGPNTVNKMMRERYGDPS